ncbi:LOG family protein [Rubrivivax albus]|uniref:Cytokinin riboside 5'-monophosphate phosphoribohydrolase n=1 Tax=Rubrivivax albus TaxID=2499835 RepID=A0A3S2TPQ7_9BURK|nr:TIGR00730 family Rossman fold protein [Rubrivivax albus]RVT54130.1 TIGR00730 family Rossman fold protein [Rubrivivax albus]
MNLCVYCGSRAGVLPAYADAARALGTLLGQGGHGLVYGGGNVGLMGIVADAALAAGAPVVGVIPQALVQREVGHTALSEQHVVPDMHVRKRMMAERADAFVALPGGIGTLEELYEVWTWRQLGYHDKPIGLLNVAGFYDQLLAFMGHCVAQGFLDEAQRNAVLVDTDPARLLQRLADAAVRATAPDDYSRI